MMSDSSKTPDSQAKPGAPAQERRERLGEALRANLRRRKTQTRAREDAEAAPAPGTKADGAAGSRDGT